MLDDTDYSGREHEATLENMADAAWRFRHEFELPADWTGRVSDWFWEQDPAAVENRDDQGGCPSEGQLRRAFVALGFRRAD